MCVLGVCDAISNHWGAKLTAMKVIPQLAPLLVSETLSHSQFSTYMTLLRKMLDRIEEKSGSLLMQQEPIKSLAASSSAASGNVTVCLGGSVLC